MLHSSRPRPGSSSPFCPDPLSSRHTMLCTVHSSIPPYYAHWWPSPAILCSILCTWWWKYHPARRCTMRCTIGSKHYTQSADFAAIKHKLYHQVKITLCILWSQPQPTFAKCTSDIKYIIVLLCINEATHRTSSLCYTTAYHSHQIGLHVFSSQGMVALG